MKMIEILLCFFDFLIELDFVEISQILVESLLI